MTRFVACLLLLLPLASFGQKMLWSTPQKITNNNYYTQILGQNRQGIYFYQTSKTDQKRNIHLFGLEFNMKSKARQEFITSSKERLEKVVLLSNSIAIFYSLQDKREGNLALYVKHLSPDLTEIVDDRKLFSISTSDFSDDYFRVIPSRQQNEVAVLSPQNVEQPQGTQIVRIYDYQLREQRRNVLLFESQGAVINRSYLINGHLFLVAMKEIREGIFKKTKQKTLIKHNTLSGNTIVHKLHSDDWNCLKGKFFYSPSDSFYYFSSYYFTADSSAPKGFMLYAFSTTNDSAELRKTVFPQAMLDDLFGKGQGFNSGNELILQKTLKRTDGGIIYISEKHDVDEQIIQDNSVYGIQQTRYYYYYYDISLASFNPDGTLDWHQTIKKEQVTLNDDGFYSSFGCEVSRDRLYFVYNDLSRKTGNVMIYALRPDGESRGEILINGRDFDGYAIPKESVQLNGNALLVPMMKPREGITLLKLEF